MSKKHRGTLTASRLPQQSGVSQDTKRALNLAAELDALLGPWLKANPDVAGIVCCGISLDANDRGQYILSATGNLAHKQKFSPSLVTTCLVQGLIWTDSVTRQMRNQRAAINDGKAQNAAGPERAQ